MPETKDTLPRRTETDDNNSSKEENGTEEKANVFIHLNKLNAELMEKNYQLIISKAELEHSVRGKNLEIEKLTARIEKLLSKLKEYRDPPLMVGEIMENLDDLRLVVKTSVGHIHVVKNMLKMGEGEKLAPGNRIMMEHKNLNVVELLTSSKDPIISGAQLLERPSETYQDVGGLDNEIQEMTEMVELPLTKPHLFRRIGIKPPKGILLVGPPGNGKTLLAKAVANKTKAAFIRLVGSELVQKYIGEGSRLVRELFQLAREEAPSIIFIDEIDAVGAQRMGMNTSGDREVQRTLMQLLAELDGFRSLENVSIIAATNRPDILDKALLRPGRFDRIVEIPQPGPEAIRKIFHIHCKKLKLDWRARKKIDMFADMCEGFSGAKIRNVCLEAGMETVREDGKRITVSQFLRAIEKMKTGRGDRKKLSNTLKAKNMYQ